MDVVKECVQRAGMSKENAGDRMRLMEMIICGEP